MKALLVVDPNQDFFPGWALGVPGADALVKPINRAIAYASSKGWAIIISRDWHPATMRKHFEKWPRHCVQGTPGAAFHPDLDTKGAVVISKGMDPDDDENTYSPFAGVNDHGESLDTVLRNLGVTELFVCCLVLEYCVRAACLDGVKRGYTVHLLLDLTLPVNVNPGDGQQALEDLRDARVDITNSAAVMSLPV